MKTATLSLSWRTWHCELSERFEGAKRLYWYNEDHAANLAWLREHGYEVRYEMAVEYFTR